MTTRDLKKEHFTLGLESYDWLNRFRKTTSAALALGQQLLRAGTSVGANYRAAARARSRADFVAKLGIVEEECDEAIYWMELLSALKLVKAARLANLFDEGNQLLAIVVSSINTARKRPRT